MQIEELRGAGMHYITAISKPQIETLLNSCTLQTAFFDQPLGEVLVPRASAGAEAQDPDTSPGMERYILRRNPVRRAEMGASRTAKQQALMRSIVEANIYLKEHPRGKVSTQHKKLEKKGPPSHCFPAARQHPGRCQKHGR